MALIGSKDPQTRMRGAQSNFREALSNSMNQPEKRQRSVGHFSFTDSGAAGLIGTCGEHIGNEEFVISKASGDFSRSDCGKQIRILYKGKSAVATIKSECFGCQPNGFDMTKGLFQFFESNLNAGIIDAEWELLEPGSPPAATTNPAPTSAPSNLQAPTDSLATSALSISAAGVTSKGIQPSSGTSTTSTVSSTISENTPAPNASDDGEPEGTSLPVGAAVGIAIGSVIAILVALFVIQHCRRRKTQRVTNSGHPEPFSTSERGAILPISRHLLSKNAHQGDGSSHGPLDNRSSLSAKDITSPPRSSHTPELEDNPPNVLAVREINHEDSGVRITSQTHQLVRVVLEHPPPYTMA